MPTRFRRLARPAPAAALAAALLLAGCYTEGGPMMSVDRFTYASTSWQPKTVSLIDTRTGETVWSMDIPVGKQLAMQFFDDAKARETGATPDPWRPQLMRWEVMDLGTQFGRLSNQIAVPGPNARRVDMKLRPAPELPSEEARGPYEPSRYVTPSDAPPPSHTRPTGGPQ